MKISDFRKMFFYDKNFTFTRLMYVFIAIDSNSALSNSEFRNHQRPSFYEEEMKRQVQNSCDDLF